MPICFGTAVEQILYFGSLPHFFQKYILPIQVSKIGFSHLGACLERRQYFPIDFWHLPIQSSLSIPHAQCLQVLVSFICRLGQEFCECYHHKINSLFKNCGCYNRPPFSSSEEHFVLHVVSYIPAAACTQSLYICLQPSSLPFFSLPPH